MKKIIVIIAILCTAGGVLFGLLRLGNAQDSMTTASVDGLTAGNNTVGGETIIESSSAMVAPEFIKEDGNQDSNLQENLENDLDIKVLREQMNKERDLQQQIKLRSLELERARLQLDQEKALTEMHQLRKSNQGLVRDTSGEGTTVMPDIKAVFIGIGGKSAEAIISINGVNFTVKPGDKPQDNVLVKSIDLKNVIVVVNGTKEVSLTPNLME